MTVDRKQVEAQGFLPGGMAELDGFRARLSEEQSRQGMYETLAAAVTQMRTPFNILHAALEMLRRRVAQQRRDEPLLDVLLAVQEQGLAILERMQQSLPEMPLNHAASINLNQLIHQVLITRAERLLAAGIVLDWQPQKVLPSFTGSEVRMRCLIGQLLDNAIQAILQRSDGARTIAISTVVRDEWVQCVIHDSGPGIVESERLKVFEPFYSSWTRRFGHHAGMGLSLAQDIINLHGATLEIDPQAQGCRIVMHFPVNNGKPV